LVQETLITRARLSEDQKQRRQTIVPLVRSIIKYGIYFSAAVIVLKQLGINPTPVLAGAGIVGLAVGLGAQNLINDVLSGFFILFEEYFLVGDFIRVAEAEGTVESIDLRTTRIRDNDGRQHILPNGQIIGVTNYAKQYTYAVVDVGVAYESDIDIVFEVLDAVGKRIQESDSDVLEPTQVKGLQAFGESELTMRTVTKVKPGRHLQVERDLRKMIKEAFDDQDIEIPYARRVVILQQPDAQALAGGEAPDPVPSV
jgi:small conductance mechanosensitive channel